MRFPHIARAQAIGAQVFVRLGSITTKTKITTG
jgi:hypothetical protein